MGLEKLNVKKVDKISVARFYETNRSSLALRLQNSPLGMARNIRQPALNRPGLALAGYFGYFAHERIQVFGAAEMAYLSTLRGEERRERLAQVCSDDVPCLIFSRNAEVPHDVLAMADANSISVFSTSLPTMTLMNRATIILENEFADSSTVHACAVDVRGVGVLITGVSGIGKSEIALGLVERGAALVADDAVRIRNRSGKIIACAPNLCKGYIEIRGIGIMNVTTLYGYKAMRHEVAVDLVINLTKDEPIRMMDRLGLSPKKISVLGVEVDRLNLPVAPGRDMSRLVEVAAMSQYLRNSGVDIAAQFNNALHNEIARNSKN